MFQQYSLQHYKTKEEENKKFLKNTLKKHIPAVSHGIPLFMAYCLVLLDPPRCLCKQSPPACLLSYARTNYAQRIL